MKLKSNCVSCFCGLSVDSRIAIVNLLQEKGKMSVSAIAKQFSLSQPTITHHLHYLENAGILASEKKGRRVFYSIHTKCKKGECHVFA